MIAFRCPGCQTVHRVDDTLGGTRFHCPQCQKLMMVPRAPTPSAPTPAAPPATDPLPSPIVALPASQPAAIAPLTASVLAPPPQSQPTEPTPAAPWYCAVDGERRGPMTERAVYELIDRDDLLPSDLVWRQGWNEWEPASNYFDFPRSGRDRSRDDIRLPKRKDDSAGTICGILSIVCGIIALLLCPPLFGIAGIVLASVSLGISEKKTLGGVGLAVSIIGMIGGMIIGVLVMTALQRH